MTAVGRTIIAGAGPGGLTLAHQLQRAGRDFLLFEKRLPGGSVEDVGKHGSRGNIALWSRDDLVRAGLGDIATAWPSIDAGVPMAAVGRFEREVRAVVARGPGSLQFGTPVVDVRPRGGGGVDVGVGGTRDEPGEWLEADELVNFSGGSLGVEDEIGLGRTPWPGAQQYGAAQWPAQGRMPNSYLEGRRAIGMHTARDGAYLVMDVGTGDVAPTWISELEAEARRIGVHGARRGVAHLFTAEQAVARRARAGDVLSGGDSVSLKLFFTASGARTAVEDALDMGTAIVGAAARPDDREPILVGLDRGIVGRHVERAIDNAYASPGAPFRVHPDVDVDALAWRRDAVGALSRTSLD